MRKSKTTWKQIKLEHNDIKFMGHRKKSSKREVYKCLPHEARKILNKQSNLTPKRARKRRTNKTQTY